MKMNVLVAQTWSLCQQLRSLLLLCKQMLMMGFPCADKQAVCPSLSPLHHFTRKHVFSSASHHFTDMTHTSLFFFFTPLCFFFFLNSSLFSARVYFYPSVHGRSQRNDEAWETCSSPWQLYSKPSFPNAAFITTSHTSVALILLSQLSGMFSFFFIFSPLENFLPSMNSSPRLNFHPQN